MSRPSARCTAPITCASEGSALVAAVTASASFIQASKPFLRRSASRRPAPCSCRDWRRVPPGPTRASATSGRARCLAASKTCVLRPMIVLSGFLNSAQEPVVKSCSRVPTASTTSASSHERVGGGGAGDADRAHVQRMGEGQRGFAALGLDDRNAMALGKARERRRRLPNRARRRRR